MQHLHCPRLIFSSAEFTYDADTLHGISGKRVKSALTTNVETTDTYFIGNYYEVAGGVVTKYYYAGTQRIALRKNGVLMFIIGDHLGSTSLVTDATGAVINQTQYKACPLTSFGMLCEGEERYSSGAKQTNYGYTGQYSYESDFGLHFYNARWYDSSLGRFTQADTIVPAGVQGYDRYAAMENNPVRYVDPTGHMVSDGLLGGGGGCDRQCWDERNEPKSPAPKGGGGGSGDEDDIISSLKDTIEKTPDFESICGFMMTGASSSDIDMVCNSDTLQNFFTGDDRLSLYGLYSFLFLQGNFEFDGVGFGRGYNYGIPNPWVHTGGTAGVDGLYLFGPQQVYAYGYAGVTTNGLNAGLSKSWYAIAVFNVDKASDYSGPTRTSNFTFARGVGISINSFWSASGNFGDPNIPQGFSVSIVKGYQLSFSQSLIYTAPPFLEAPSD